MPNWCQNNVTIEGDTTELEKLLPVYQGEKIFTFNSILPIPENLKENWYDWNRENWGTKWDLDDGEDDRDEVTFFSDEMTFQTAWCPPMKLLLYISEKYNLTIYISATDSNACMKAVIENGKYIFHEEFNMEMLEDEDGDYVEDEDGEYVYTDETYAEMERIGWNKATVPFIKEGVHEAQEELEKLEKELLNNLLTSLKGE